MRSSAILSVFLAACLTALYTAVACTLLLTRQIELLLLVTFSAATLLAWLAWHAFLRKRVLMCSLALFLLFLSVALIVLALADVLEPGAPNALSCGEILRASVRLN